MIRFDIPYPPTKKGKSAFCKQFGLNAYYSGKHWQARKRDAEQLHTMAILAMKQAGIRRRMVDGPVEVRFLWNDGMDIDNHAVIGKAVVDAMKGYILPDDNRRWVKKVSHAFWEGDSIRVEIAERCDTQKK